MGILVLHLRVLHQQPLDDLMGNIVGKVLHVSGILDPYLALGDLVIPRPHVMMPAQGKLDRNTIPN